MNDSIKFPYGAITMWKQTIEEPHASGSRRSLVAPGRPSAAGLQAPTQQTAAARGVRGSPPGGALARSKARNCRHVGLVRYTHLDIRGDPAIASGPLWVPLNR